MSGLLPNVDPDGLLEFSVVYTDRSLNHMSNAFQHVMRDLSGQLKSVYNADAVAIIPGSGTFGMEAVARQFANGKKAMVIRNGWFSYRWTQIFEMAGLPREELVLKARFDSDDAQAQLSPYPIEEAVDAIRNERPDVVFAPHVETSAGMILPDEYIKAVADAAHEVGALFVLDCIASGAIWVDMKALGVDVLCSAPQKGWSGSPCAGLVMMSQRARDAIENTTSNSFACDLKKWLQIMEAYENGGHAYHATMPTDGLRQLRDVMAEAEKFGFAELKAAQARLGKEARELLASRGIKSLAADGFGAPGVIVNHTTDSDIQNGSRFAQAGFQIAAGVPLMCDEPEGFCTFRIGLFGIDKLMNVDRTLDYLKEALDKAGL
ncbi:Soluble hydrogenase 42 kDa subunit [Marinobacterium sp. xm-a-121]|uniref:aminotransferase class V-fold PLP-dependent enzyme n=1 Tax=unclassified Marinobacterium TaxID=2644139 RepID=UPI001568EA78|nr:MULTISPECIES: aminotransferase class V-fold PLP-dependent enzyme [unclassified Marinobacterium]NRP09931.1 Soluble hydrogenase 42 kDa subunit [Marinobacterium sp. xm-g-48]NRP39451.1 Soluble hydrogenase 42 kDa subunit [Marinobacterium sp. xm-a-121]NRP47445.1 Soluble hydrogenase 42 kDa subunit [Marinobacterium sp. xm-d-543]NRP60162.1 Soluble hydrogenase 42 kDa subunit [Marinobacterium sp. xm-d-564]NRP82775.1 Soluble hydrogenase 42 kDa subunit [Marinobacterium sp. xm-d-509]